MPPPLEPIAIVDASVGLAAIARPVPGRVAGSPTNRPVPRSQTYVRPSARRRRGGRRRQVIAWRRCRSAALRDPPALRAAGVDVPDEGDRVRLVDDEGAVREKLRPVALARWQRSGNGRLRLPVPELRRSLVREGENACRPGLDQCAVEHVARGDFDRQTLCRLPRGVEEVQRLVIACEDEGTVRAHVDTPDRWVALDPAHLARGTSCRRRGPARRCSRCRGPRSRRCVRRR